MLKDQARADTKRNQLDVASEGALMNILYSAKERQKYGGKTAQKYNPLSQLLLGCSGRITPS